MLRYLSAKAPDARTRVAKKQKPAARVYKQRYKSMIDIREIITKLNYNGIKCLKNEG